MTKIVLSHRQIERLEKRGILLPPLEIKPTLPKKQELVKRTARQILARVLDKAIRQFEAEGCPEIYDLKVHIDQMLKRLEEIGYVPRRDNLGRFAPKPNP